MKPNVWTPRSKWLVGLLVGVAAFNAIAVDSRAQDVKVRLESVGGPFSLYAVENTWVERVATVINESDSPRQLRVAYLASTQGKQTRYTRTCDLPPHTDRRMQFGAYLRDLKPSGRPFGEQKYDEITDIFLLSDAKTDQELMRIPESRGRIPSHILTICRIGGSNEDSAGNPEIRKLISNSIRDYQAVQSMTMGQLPDRWYGYSMGGMVMLGESQLGTLRLSQRQALLEYVRRGGVMLILGTEKLGEMLRGDLADAAGVTVLGYHKTQSIQLPTSGGTEVRKYASPQTFVELCPDQAEVLAYSDGLPLLTKHALGRGHVFVLTAPLMAVNEATLRLVEQTRSLQPPLKEDEFAEPAKAVLSQIAGRPGPVRLVPVAILLGMAALVLIGGLVAKFRGRGERVWALLVPLAIVISVGMYAQREWRSGDANPRLNTVGLVSGIGDGLARVEQVFAYGAPGRETDTFSSDTFSGTIADIGETGSLGAEVEARSGSVMSMPNQAVDPDSTRAFRVEEVLSTGDVASRLTFGPKGLTGSIQNGLRLDLQDAVLYVNHHGFTVGSVPAGQKFAVDGIGPAAQLADGEFTTGVLHDVLRNTLLVKLAARPSITHSVNPQPLLVGKLDGGVLTPLSKPGMTKNGWSLAVWPVTIVPPEPGSPVLVPPGFVRTQIRLGERWGVMIDSLSDARTSAIGLRGVLPPQVRGLTDAKATLKLRLRGGNYRMVLSGMGPGGRGEALHSVDAPSGLVEIIVPKAERFWSADGAFEFSMKMELIGKAGEDSISQWTLESADIALEGIAK